ncbi:MAG TPA: 4-(cytidine 5'-diphospho)-2-C-methyl-D-erythritol kinase [Methylomirabilota bacterium]|nr:4-(cytidine 5'-diphospho)-2-C-methyl-D-erythritol kinase [Methylomirabilota bacterium]
MTLTRLSHCKVNFILNILGKRPDGYHEVETVLFPVPMTDCLEFTRRGVGIQLTCSDPELPTDDRNLMVKAARAFFNTSRIPAQIQMHLEKRLPVAAGIGGGSANAAGTLLALNELFERVLTPAELTEIAATLGADVPFFLQDRPALGTGRGENVHPLAPFSYLEGRHIVLIHPGFGVSTPWAYRELQRFPTALSGEPGRAQRLIEALHCGAMSEAWKDFYNSLEAPVLDKHPILALYQDALRESGAEVALMSGSGSSTFAIFQTKAEAEAAVEQFKSRFGTACWIGLASL